MRTGEWRLIDCVPKCSPPMFDSIQWQPERRKSNRPVGWCLVRCQHAYAVANWAFNTATVFSKRFVEATGFSACELHWNRGKASKHIA